jgi:hypothetical protein
MRSLQVHATQLPDASDAQLEGLRARSRELRLRISDLQTREQQIRELRMQSPPTSPDRALLDKQWMDVHHSLTAATLELEAVNDRTSDLRTQRDQALREQAQREQARVATLRPSPAGLEPPPVEVPDFASVRMAVLGFILAPIVLILIYRFLTRGRTQPDPFGLDASPRFQRLEQTVETIAMEVERIAEGQRFTTAILAERHPGAVPRTPGTPLQESDRITPR